MASCDLHLHTTFSDGTQSPEAVVAAAAARGVRLLAITDHDEVGGVLPAQQAGAQLGVTVISGVEINTEVGKEDVHILGYGFAPDSPALLAGLHALRNARLVRAEQMLARLTSIGYPLTLEQVLAISGEGSVGRPHIARALVAAGYVADVATAFSRLIGNRCPAFIPRAGITPEEAIALIHRAGGIASLAHPGKLGDPIRFIQRLRAAGLDALEVYHSDHPPKATQRLARWAAQYCLAMTGGSDSHGEQGPRVVCAGSVPIPEEIATDFIALLETRRLAVPYGDAKN